MLLAAAPLPRSPLPEKPDLSPAKLRELATHVVVGEVKQIWTRSEKANGWSTTHSVAEISVTTVEKGSELAAGSLVYARYWQRTWVGPSDPPADTTGHRYLPSVGETRRVFLARDAYDGFGETRDGGFNVLGANGFEKR
jgi:hypothetical protein